jgi:hypothetical protein
VAAGAAELERTDLAPFRAAVAAGVASIMTAHVAYPGLDPSGRPATLSGPILRRLRAMGFEGLVASDALIMAGIRGAGSPETAAVEAVRAGIDCLLYPPDPVATAGALARAAASDRELAAAVERALGRLDRAVARVAPAPPPGPVPLSGALAERLVREAAPAEVSLRRPLELVVVDDDRDGAYPPSPSDWVARRLGERGVPLGPGGGKVILAFAEPRASKGRSGFGPASRDLLLAATAGADLTVLFAHPRLAAQLPGGPPVLVAWHRQRLLQEAVADWLVDRVG